MSQLESTWVPGILEITWLPEITCLNRWLKYLQLNSANHVAGHSLQILDVTAIGQLGEHCGYHWLHSWKDLRVVSCCLPPGPTRHNSRSFRVRGTSGEGSQAPLS